MSQQSRKDIAKQAKEIMCIGSFNGTDYLTLGELLQKLDLSIKMKASDVAKALEAILQEA